MARPKRSAHQMARVRPTLIEPNAVYRRTELPVVLRVGRGTVELALRNGELRRVIKGRRMLVRGAWLLDYLERGDTPRPQQ